MMTRPIHYFDSLTSETSSAGGNAYKVALSHDERRVLEKRARFARADLVGKFIGEAALRIGQGFKHLFAAVKADFSLRNAEAQLHRMSDRELSDLGLCRADIPFAVRDVRVEGVAPQIDNHHAAEVAAANRNASPTIFWAGRA